MSILNTMQPSQVTTVSLVDGSSMAIEIYGSGTPLLLPVNPHPVEGEAAEQLRQYGADPALGQALIQGLSDLCQVIAFDYEGHLWQQPRPETLTPDNVVQDLLRVADAAGAEHFIYYGYSWLAMIGLQLALHTDRLAGLGIGGFPPLDGPYAEMLKVTTAGYQMAEGRQPAYEPDDKWSTAPLTKAQTRQYMKLYETLQDFDDAAALKQITCPRLCFVGSADDMEYGKNWGDVFLKLAEPVIRNRAELEALGWKVHILEGLDHMQAMQAAQVLPILRPWLAAARSGI